MNCVTCTAKVILQGLSSRTSSARVMMASRTFASDNKNNGKLSGKVAIVTASTEGIGYGIAHSLASHGASVMISSRKVCKHR